MKNECLHALIARLGTEFVLTSPETCWPYGTDNTDYFVMPSAVVFPANHDDVVYITQLCHTHHMPLVPRGLGSGTVGGAIPLNHAIVMDMTRMNQIIHIDPLNRVMIAEPGVTNFAIQQAAKIHGLCWAPDPGSRTFCTLGGNLAHNSAGPRAIKYGTVRENTLALTAVTGKGDTIHTGAYTSKSVVGYDLTRLLIGSEGTLATITQATLKLLPLQSEQRTIRALYRSIEGATEAVSAIMGQPILPSALEFMDESSVQLVRDYAHLDLPKETKALLLIGVDGNADNIEHHIKIISQKAKHADLIQLNIANTATEEATLWKARRHLSPCLKKLAPKKINEDVVVPVAALPQLMNAVKKIAQEYAMLIVCFGHAGNGNIHVNIMYDPNDPSQQHNAAPCVAALFHLVLQLKGSLSGEHGIGLNKQAFIEQEVDTATLCIMKQIKTVFDPHHILNPGKIFP